MNKLLKNSLCVLCGATLLFGATALAACNGTPSDDTEKDDEKGTVDITYTESDVYGNQYIKYHNEGDTVEYVFEAECTNLENKSGNTYSGNAGGSDMAISGGTDASNGAVVGYLYNYGNSVNFIIVSDRDVTDATLVLRCGAEFNDTTLNASTLTVRSEPVADKSNGIDAEAFLTPYQDGGYWGKWDSFLDYFNMDLEDLDNYNFGGQLVSPFECGSISIPAAGVMKVTGISDFTITLKLKLWKGVNSVSFITNNSDVPKNTETQRATAVVIDCIKITTTAQLGMYNPQDNGYGTENACTYKAVED